MAVTTGAGVPAGKEKPAGKEVRALPPSPPPVPTFDKAFAFVDLVSLAVVGQISERSVAEAEMRQGVAYLQKHTGYDKPLSHQDVIENLATSGQAFIAHLDDNGDWYDVGKGGQGTFNDIVCIYLKHLAFNDFGVAQRWKPARHVVLDPRIQAGAPCMESTRIPTHTIADLA